MAAIVAHDALGLAGRAGGVENVKRVGGLDRHAVDRMRPGHAIVPVEVPLRDQLGLGLRPLKEDAVAGLVARLGDRRIEHGLVAHHPARLEAAGGREDQDGLRVVDAGCQLVGRKAAEDDRMDGADAGAGEHGDHRLGHHRHIENDAVAMAGAVLHQRAGKSRDQRRQLGIGEGADQTRDRAVVDQRRLGAAPGGDVAVERVETGVEPAALEPSGKGRAIEVPDAGPAAVPVQRLSRLTPKAFGIAERPLVEARIRSHQPAPCRHSGDHRKEAGRRQRGGMAAGRAGFARPFSGYVAFFCVAPPPPLL